MWKSAVWCLAVWIVLLRGVALAETPEQQAFRADVGVYTIATMTPLCEVSPSPPVFCVQSGAHGPVVRWHPAQSDLLIVEVLIEGVLDSVEKQLDRAMSSILGRYCYARKCRYRIAVDVANSYHEYGDSVRRKIGVSGNSLLPPQALVPPSPPH